MLRCGTESQGTAAKVAEAPEYLNRDDVDLQESLPCLLDSVNVAAHLFEPKPQSLVPVQRARVG